MIATLLAIGAFGFLGLSVLCPLLALPWHYFRRRRSREKPSPDPPAPAHPLFMEIVIPAHNEAEWIGATLASIHRSVQDLQACPSVHPQPKIMIRVGTDGCTDQTSDIARRFPMVSVTEFPENRSKWITIKSLLEGSSADWIILVDAGTLWPERFLAGFVRRIDEERDAIAIAPSYRPLRAGWLSRILWQIETGLKRIEAFCGGPVSLHGATVGYKTALLKKVLAYLGDTLWLNDDVVIPLILRALHPEGVIVYPAGQVQDAGAGLEQPDFGRRKRMLLGNLQWVRALLPECFRRNPVAGVVAVRRLFRVLWAYWLAFIALGLALAFHSVVLPAAAALGILWVWSGSFRQLAGAALVSLLAPIHLVRLEGRLGGSWK